MPCYVNPNVAKHERELCEQKWKFFRVVAAAVAAGVRWPSDIAEFIESERRDYLAHREEDRDFLVRFLDERIAGGRADLAAVKRSVIALTDDELVSTYWGTWEDEQLAAGQYRGQVLSETAHPDPHVVAA